MKLTNHFTVGLVLLGCVVWAWLTVNFSIPPFEDAAILMRYSEHLALGHGIVWNIGEAPVDGATDFLLMIAIGILRMTGISLEMSTRLIPISAHLLTIVVIFFATRGLFDAPMWAAIVAASYFAIGPGFFLSAAYFGTSLFALFIALSWIAGLKIIYHNQSTSGIVIFSFLSLISGLIRPEGVLIVGFMLLSVVLMLGLKRSWKIIVIFGAVFLIFGGMYFLWRWNYFGHPLPNPFYKKGGGSIYLGSLVSSIKNVVELCFHFIPIFFLGLRSSQLRKKLISFAIPIVGATCMWVLLSNEMNFGARFQYAVMPIVLLSWYPFVKDLRLDLKMPEFNELSRKMQTALKSVGIVLFLGIMITRTNLSQEITYQEDGRYDVGKLLSKYTDKGYTLASTEAGLVPLYSQWTSIDTWGLNDQWIAHNGGLTMEYLEEKAPQFLLWHEWSSLVLPPDPNRPSTAWGDMVSIMREYAEKHNFVLIAAFGETPHNTHYYYVSPDIPESDEIVNAIRTIKYHWFHTGLPAVNFSNLSASD